MSPTQSPRTASWTLTASRVVLVVLPLGIVAAAFLLGQGTSSKRLVAALGVGCFAASVSFYLAFCLRVAVNQSATSGTSFGKNFAKTAGLFALALVFFALALFLASDSPGSASQGDKPGVFDGIDGFGCVTLAQFFGPIVLGFLLLESTKSMP